jgi:hypothetical protein
MSPFSRRISRKISGESPLRNERNARSLESREAFPEEEEGGGGGEEEEGEEEKKIPMAKKIAERFDDVIWFCFSASPSPLPPSLSLLLA